MIAPFVVQGLNEPRIQLGPLFEQCPMEPSKLACVEVAAPGYMLPRAATASLALAQRPVYTVVSVIGSTEESAVDPLKGVLELRHRLHKTGLSFTVHADAAWGGYFAAILRPDEEPRAKDLASGLVPESGMSRYVTSQFSALGRADSITVDPHKSGYVPYPAGALCYRHSAMRDMVRFKAPYIVHRDAEPTVGIYGSSSSAMRSSRR